MVPTDSADCLPVLHGMDHALVSRGAEYRNAIGLAHFATHKLRDRQAIQVPSIQPRFDAVFAQAGRELFHQFTVIVILPRVGEKDTYRSRTATGGPRVTRGHGTTWRRRILAELFLPPGDGTRLASGLCASSVLRQRVLSHLLMRLVKALVSPGARPLRRRSPKRRERSRRRCHSGRGMQSCLTEPRATIER